MQQGRRRSRGIGHEQPLLEYAQRIARHRRDRLVVWVHLSRLRPWNRQVHHIRIAATVFDPLLHGAQGQLFALSDGDLVFAARLGDRQDMAAMVARLAYLFGEDPLLRDDPDRFQTWYRLEDDYERFLAAAQAAVNARARRLKEEAERMEKGEVARDAPAPLSPATLDRIQEALGSADVSNLVRRQPVCAVAGSAPPSPVFDEVYVSIADLQNTLTPDIDLAADRWLFQHLTRLLDRRILQHLRQNDDRTLDHAFSVNLNVATVLSPAFLDFDSDVSVPSRGTILVEFQNIDVLSDMAAFSFAREVLRDRRYRVCLDGVTHMTLPFVDRERLGLDLVKILWNPDMADDRSGRLAEELARMVERTGGERVILCRCDSAAAIDFGRSAGISLFQGRWIDTLLGSERAASVDTLTMKEALARGGRAPVS